MRCKVCFVVRSCEGFPVEVCKACENINSCLSHVFRHTYSTCSSAFFLAFPSPSLLLIFTKHTLQSIVSVLPYLLVFPFVSLPTQLLLVPNPFNISILVPYIKTDRTKIVSCRSNESTLHSTHKCKVIRFDGFKGTCFFTGWLNLNYKYK